MASEQLNYLQNFIESFKQLVIFNTIADHPNSNGLTYYDLTQIDPHIPHSRIYRAMKKLTEEGYLNETEEKRTNEKGIEMGRPKKYYTLTNEGGEHRKILQEDVQRLANDVIENLTRDLSKFNLKNMPRPRMGHCDEIIDSDDTPEEKLQKLTEHEDHLKAMLKKVVEVKKKVQAQLK